AHGHRAVTGIVARSLVAHAVRIAPVVGGGGVAHVAHVARLHTLRVHALRVHAVRGVHLGGDRLVELDRPGHRGIDAHLEELVVDRGGDLRVPGGHARCGGHGPDPHLVDGQFVDRGAVAGGVH